MAHRKFDVAQQFATGTGTGALTAAGATSAMYRTFADAGMVEADTCYVRVQNVSVAAEWQVCLMTLTGGTFVFTFDDYSSSATGAQISFTAGTKIVSGTIAAAAAVMLTPDGVVEDTLVIGGAASASLDLRVPGSGAYDGRFTSDGAIVTLTSASGIPLQLAAQGSGSGIYFSTNAVQRYIIGDSGTTTVGTVNVTPAAGTTKAFATAQVASGTVAGPHSLNYFEITSDAIDGDNGVNLDHFVYGFHFTHFAGGSTVKGGREALKAEFELTAATNSTNNNRNYVGGAFYATAADDDGGSGTTYGTAQGAMFGGFSAGILEAPAVNMLGVCSWEFDVAMFAGSSAYSKAVAIFSNRSDDVEQGSVIDTMLWLFKQIPPSGSTPVWTTGILFDFPDDAAGFPFDDTSTVLKVGTGTIGIGIDLSSCTVDQYAYRSPGFSVGGAGAVVGLSGSFNSGTAVIGADSAGSLSLGGVNKTPYIDFNSYNGTANDYDVRLAGTGGSASTDGAGTFTVYSATNVFTGHITVADAKVIGWASRSFLASPADGVITLTNNATTDFGRVQFGGTTSSFPALKRSGAALQVRLADDSAYGGMTALSFTSATAGAILASIVTITGGGTGNVPTLVAGPVTGDPTKWLPYDDNGTTRYIPSW